MNEYERGIVPIAELPIVGKVFRELDLAIGEKGLPIASRDFILEHDSKLEVAGRTKEVERILRSEPVLVIANHGHEAETVALYAALLQRDDIYTVGVAAFQGIGPNFSKHLIPVYVRPSSVDPSEMKLSSRIGRALSLGTDMPENAHELNKASIARAAQIISGGGLVVMFPSGARKKNIWSPGVGHLIIGINKDCGAYIVKAHIKGTSNLDFLRLVPGLKKLMPPLRVTFAEPRSVTDYLKEKVDPKELVFQLQDEYTEWLEQEGLAGE
ncbi:1-acyl-sn-glycerol-3-phosphate acyltransferase [Candidatus Microgenomates bacterium]|nr:1-acyl-sn-glycerol-3-phosphate acyltransferase [Candidatus Microgenomates bacterium]